MSRLEEQIENMTFWVIAASYMTEDGFSLAMSMAPAPSQEIANDSFLAVLQEKNPGSVILNIGILEVDPITALENIEIAKKILRGEDVDFSS